MCKVSMLVLHGGESFIDHFVKLIRTQICSCASADISVEPLTTRSPFVRHKAFSKVYTSKRMLPSCSRVFSRDGRMTTMRRPDRSLPERYCFPVCNSSSMSSNVISSGLYSFLHNKVFFSISNAFKTSHFLARKFLANCASEQYIFKASVDNRTSFSSLTSWRNSAIFDRSSTVIKDCCERALEDGFCFVAFFVSDSVPLAMRVPAFSVSSMLTRFTNGDFSLTLNVLFTPFIIFFLFFFSNETKSSIVKLSSSSLIVTERA